MKFLYKIYSGFDGFFPKRISKRLVQGKLLRLGWHRYIDLVEIGTEVWVYFHGPHSFENGVYAKGIVQSINETARLVFLRVRDYTTDDPLTEKKTSAQIASVVSPRNRQVFLLPEEWETLTTCTIGSTASSCEAKLCGSCSIWKDLPLIQSGTYRWPSRLRSEGLSDFVPAYWVIPSRCYLGKRAGSRVRKTTELFYRFKVGEKTLSHPLALGMFEALRKRKLIDFDAVVPIPLSPDKAKVGEEHRTRLLGKELARLLGTRLVELLTLKAPISKRLMILNGATPSQFEDKYYQQLEVDEDVKSLSSILLVDDVCTKGSTLRTASKKILDLNPQCLIVGVTSGQMILKETVISEKRLVEE